MFIKITQVKVISCIIYIYVYIYIYIYIYIQYILYTYIHNMYVVYVYYVYVYISLSIQQCKYVQCSYSSFILTIVSSMLYILYMLQVENFVFYVVHISIHNIQYNSIYIYIYLYLLVLGAPYLYMQNNLQISLTLIFILKLLVDMIYRYKVNEV